MKKSGKSKPRKRAASKKATQHVGAEPSRRDVLRMVRNGGLGAAALGGVGWWVVSGVRAVAYEQDLTRMGQGKPSIVQIHDPQCALCTELQREARQALKCFDDADLLYLVASIRTDEGAAFAASLGLPHVTLVLLDGAGDVQQVLQGVRRRDELKDHFAGLAPRLTT